MKPHLFSFHSCWSVCVAIACCALAAPARAADPDSPPELARLVADRVLKDFQKPLPFDWGEGVLMAGMVEAGVALHEPRYIDFVRRWADHWDAYGIERLLAGDEGKRLKGYCGQWGPGYPVMLLYERTKNARYLEIGRKIADFILKKATRTSSGGLGHWLGNYQLWVDTLYMHGPLLAHLQRADPQPPYGDDIIKQLDVYSEVLQDPATGLFYHMFDEPAARHSPEFWARGNGWVAMTYAEVLPVAGRKPRENRRHEQGFQHMVRTLRALQDRETGLWHTVLNRPDSYLETSASAMILASFLRGHQRGLLKDNDPALIRLAWSGLTDRVDNWGWVFGTSGGTGPGPYESYARKVSGTYTWGTGAFLIAASEMVVVTP